MACQITNNSNLDTSDFEDTIQQLVSFSQDRFGFEKPPALFLNSDPSNASDPLGKTAYYDPENKEVHIYVDERHPKDIMRSISHELIHHVQNLRGDLSGNHYHGEGYAQKDEHMREMEREAYEQGNLCFRDFEDKLKLDKTTYNEWRTNKMSLKEWKNNELFTLLSGKWGFGKNTITEGAKPFDDGDNKDEKLEEGEDPQQKAKNLRKEIDDLRAAGKTDEADKKQRELNYLAKYHQMSLEEGEDPQQKAKNLRKEIDDLRAAGKTDEADKKQRELNYLAKYHQMSLEEGEETPEQKKQKFGDYVIDQIANPDPQQDPFSDPLDPDTMAAEFGIPVATVKAIIKAIEENEESMNESPKDNKPKFTSMKDLHYEIEDMLNDKKSVEDIVAALGVSKYDVDGVEQDMKTAKTELKEAMRKRFARLIK